MEETKYSLGKASPGGKSRASMATNRVFVCLVMAITVLSVLCVVLAGLLIWREFYADATREGSSNTNVTEIVERFPGYFRTPEEQALLTRSHPPRVPVRNTSTVYTCSTQTTCTRTASLTTRPPTQRNVTTTPAPGNNTEGRRAGRRRRQVSAALPCELDKEKQDDLTFHGCCVTMSDTLIPNHLDTAEPNQSGQVQIAQFAGFNQYFEIEECCQARDCTDCQCSQTYYVTTAVVVKSHSNGGSTYIAELVQLPGCCQCLNTFSAGLA